MKKLLFMAIALLSSGALPAQETEAKKLNNSFFVLHAGPSIPVGDFASSNIGNENAGFAKTGYTINLNYGYLFGQSAGLTANAFFNHYTTSGYQVTVAGETGGGGQTIKLDADHWQYYGVTAGPMLSFELGKAINADIRLMGGAVNANSPKITYNGIVMANGDWSWAPAVQGGINLRIGTGGNVFVFANADYQYMKPKFHYSYTDENNLPVNEDIKQAMSVANTTAGIGITF